MITPRSTRQPQSAQVITMGGSASVEPGAVLKTPPPRVGRRMTGHPLDRPLAFGEPIDATEADPDLLMFCEPQQARRHRPIATAPAAGLGEVSADSGLVHCL